MIKIKSVKIFYLELPLDNPVKTSFGTMFSRPCLLVSLIDKTNQIGLGEIWCNFPKQGSKYRFNILNELILNLLTNKEFEEPGLLINFLDEKIKTMFVQSGDMGSYHNILSGLDCAIWDLFSKNKNMPLNKLFNKNSKNFIKIYASGINPHEWLDKVNYARSLGVHAFKIKIGFNNSLDERLISDLDDNIKNNEFYMLDSNQGWKFENAKLFLKKLETSKAKWIEEPISALHSYKKILELSKYSNSQLAFGENIYNTDIFVKLASYDKISFLQPDLTKYGGISFLNLLQNKIENKKIWLHFLGSGVGLITSAHMQTVINNNAYLEMDINENPLRDEIFTEKIKIVDGKILLNEKPGLGFELNESIINKYLILSNV